MSRKLLSIGHLNATMVCRPLDTERIMRVNALNIPSPKQAIEVFSKKQLVWPKINLDRVAYFWTVNKRRFRTTIHHTNHHDFTSKLPPKNARFSRTPLKNACKRAKNRPIQSQNFFSKLNPKNRPPTGSKIYKI